MNTMYRVLILLGILTLAVSPAAFPQAPPAQAPAAAAPPEEPLPPLSVPKDYRYNARGRRDPFVNPVPKPVQAQKAAGTPPIVRPDGPKGVLVAEAQVVGIVSSREPSMNVVTIAAPGGKRYFLRTGDAIYDAVVKSIKSDSVIFVLTTPGLDPSLPREIERKMHAAPGDQK